MKSLVVGFGSIGQRHARLLRELGCDVAVVSSRTSPDFKTFPALPQALSAWSPGYVVVANPTHAHLDTLQVLIRQGFKGRVLVEKPLFKDAAPLPPHEFSMAAVAYNLRCHPVILRLKDRIRSCPDLVAASLYTGSYLPDWRPGRDYRESYSASKARGGGVLRDLSHELDYATLLFGPWTRLTAKGGCSGTLGIDSDDHFTLVMETAAVPVLTLHVNYLDRIPARQIRVTAGQHTFHADLMANTLAVDGETEAFSLERDDTYRQQHRLMLAGDTGILCDFEQGLAVMETIAAAEKAAQAHTWETR